MPLIMNTPPSAIMNSEAEPMIGQAMGCGNAVVAACWRCAVVAAPCAIFCLPARLLS